MVSHGSNRTGIQRTSLSTSRPAELHHPDFVELGGVMMSVLFQYLRLRPGSVWTRDSFSTSRAKPLKNGLSPLPPFDLGTWPSKPGTIWSTGKTMDQALACVSHWMYTHGLLRYFIDQDSRSREHNMRIEIRQNRKPYTLLSSYVCSSARSRCFRSRSQR
jgi:hypothetical protein